MRCGRTGCELAAPRRAALPPTARACRPVAAGASSLVWGSEGGGAGSSDSLCLPRQVRRAVHPQGGGVCVPTGSWRPLACARRS